MKPRLLNSIFIPVSVIALTGSLTVNANNKNDHANTEKQKAAEYWADFKQDSKQNWKDSKEAFKDGWIESKLETALILNKHLNPFEIDIRVDNNVATLEGEVHSDIDKELAENIALGVEGIDSVTNNIKVVEKSSRSSAAKTTKGRSFAQYVEDASTTAAIKTELLASKNVAGLAINVDTYNNTVTLSGDVETGAQKDLAQAIAAKQKEVKDVINKLHVKS